MPCERKHIEAIQGALVAWLDATGSDEGSAVTAASASAAVALTAAITSALAACDESPWRSMESAPKDELVLSIYATAVFPMLSLEPVRWVEDGWCDICGSVLSPTHWMPLPAAPEVE